MIDNIPDDEEESTFSTEPVPKDIKMITYKTTTITRIITTLGFDNKPFT